MRPHHLARSRATRGTLTFSLLIALVAVGMLAAAGGAVAAETQPAPGDGVGRALAEFSAGVTPEGAQAVAASCQATLVREVSRWGVDDGTTLYAACSDTLGSRELAAALRAQFSVTRAAPDGLVEGDVIPNDPDRVNQWALNRIWAYSAWELTLGDPDVVVAVLDSGLITSHPDLADNVWTNAAESAGVAGEDDDGNGHVDDIYGYDAVDDDVDLTPDTDHGIHVAGIIGAVPNNSLGVAGVGWDTKVMNLRCLSGTDNIGTNAAALDCIEYVLDQKLQRGVNVVAINTSWGGSTYNNVFMEEAIDAAEQAGIVWVASAGNDGVDLDQTTRYPATYASPNVLTVGATIYYNITNYNSEREDDTGRETDDLAVWSNYGATTVDLGAPGRDIYSVHDGNGYAWLTGTSQAAPHVTGAIALCAAKFPAETALERVDRILTGVGPHASLDGLVASGGILRIDQALVLTADDMTPATVIGGADDAWHTANVAVTLTGDDDPGIGVDYTEYKLDAGAWTRGSGLTVSTDGVHTLQYRSVDEAGRTETAQSATIKVDKSAPAAATAGADGWHTGAVEVTLTASDAISGLGVLEYRIGSSGDWIAVASGTKLAFSDEGQVTLQYRASDVAGNSTGVKEQVVRIDGTAPVSTLAGLPAGWSRTAVSPELTAEDATSGVDLVSYRINGGPWLPAPMSPIADQGVVTIEYRAVDLAGNEEAIRAAMARIDTKAPVTKGLRSTARRRARARLRFVVNDAMPGSGKATVTKIIIRNRKGKTLRTYRPKVSVTVNKTRTYRWKCTLARGRYTFVVYAKDLAGNTASRRAGKLIVR